MTVIFNAVRPYRKSLLSEARHGRRKLRTVRLPDGQYALAVDKTAGECVVVSKPLSRKGQVMKLATQKARKLPAVRPVGV